MDGFLQLKENNKFINSLVYSNTLISLGALAISAQIYLLNGLELNFFYLLFVFTSTFVSYNLQRLVRAKEIIKNNPNSWFVSKQKSLWILTVVALVISIVSLFYFLTLSIFFWLLPIGIISLFYSYKGLRNIPYLKIFLISISWGIAIGVLPFILANEMETSTIIINFTLVFLYIFAITIPFDIRDKGLDEDKKRTIPQVLGEKNAKTVALITTTIYFFLSVFTFPFFTLSFLLSSISAGVLIYYSNQKQQDLYFSFWIDIHILFQFLTVLLIYLTKLS